MKIAFISRWLAEEYKRTGGAGGAELQRVQAYQRLGHEVIALSQAEDAQPYEARALNGVQTVLTPRWRRLPMLSVLDKMAKPFIQHRKVFSDAWQLHGFLKRFGPFDALEAQCEEPDGLIVATLSVFEKLPPWCVQLFALRYKFEDRKPVFTQRKTLGFVFKRANLVKANSELVAKNLTQFYGCPEEKIRVVYPNLANQDFRRFQAARRSGTGLVLCIGALNPTKGIEVFVEAVAILAKQLPQCQFAIAGGATSNDGYAEMLKQKAQSLGIDGRLVFLGQIPAEELYHRIATATVAVIPSLFDGWNRAAIECVCIGCPVVITDQCGAASWIHKRQCGVVVPAGDSRKLAEGIQTSLSSEQRLSNSETAKTKALMEFDSHKIAEANLEVFEQLIARNTQ